MSKQLIKLLSALVLLKVYDALILLPVVIKVLSSPVDALAPTLTARNFVLYSLVS